MKILHINSVYKSGSTGRIVFDLVKKLNDLGNLSFVAYGRGHQVSDQNALRVNTDFGVLVHAFQTRVFDNHGLTSGNASLEVIKLINDFQPDIIHLHNIHGYYINYMVLFNFIKKYNKPVIWTLHDCWAFTGHCAYFEFSDCIKWKTECHNCPEKLSYPKSCIVDSSKRNFRMKMEAFGHINNLTLVTPSHWLANLVGNSFLNTYRTIVINNGIDLNVFFPKSSNFRERLDLGNRFIILGVANVWDRRKGLHFFLQLAAKITDDYIIILVGLNNKQIIQLPKNILGLPKTNNVNELVEIYSGSDVFVNPTLEDNYPTVNLEAIACGTPVITFNTGGSPESIINECGIVTTEKDAESLLSSIHIIRENHKKFKSNCMKSRYHFDKLKMISMYVDLYNETHGLLLE